MKEGDQQQPQLYWGYPQWVCRELLQRERWGSGEVGRDDDVYPLVRNQVKNKTGS